MQVFKVALLSLAPAFLIIAAALLAGKARRGALRIAGLATVAALAVLSTPMASTALLSRLEVYPPLDLNGSGVRDAQAVVILSAEQRRQPEYGRPGPGPLSLERLRYGAYLARRTRLPVLIAGGDPSGDGVPLAVSLGASLETDFGVRPRWLEQGSNDTAGNAAETARILRAAGVTRVLLVTHAWHMPRALLAFERAGLQAIPAPTAAVGSTAPAPRRFSNVLIRLIPQASGLQTTYYAIHEAIGLLVLRLSPAPAGARTDASPD